MPPPPPLDQRRGRRRRAVKFCADLVTVTEAVLLRVVPLAAVTRPRMVTVQVPPPSIEPALQVTRLTVWRTAAATARHGRAAGGTPMPPTPFN